MQISTGANSLRPFTLALALIISAPLLSACNQDDAIAELQAKVDSLNARLVAQDAKIDAILELSEQRHAEQIVEIQASRVEILSALESAQTVESLWDDASDFQRRSYNKEALQRIIWPGTSDRSALERYVGEIMQVSSKQNSFSTEDPQISMLARVGEEHIDLLLDAAAASSTGSMYAVQAVIEVATEDSKALVIDSLPSHPELVEAVVRQGWEADAKETLVEGLGSIRYLPELWVQTVAEFRDPDTYDALKNFLIRGRNRLATYDAIRYLPGIELKEAVEKGWERARAQGNWERKQMAIVAVEYGIQDALRVLITQPGAPSDFYYPRTRRAIMRHSSAGGSIENMQEWYAANEDRLYFDEAERKFKVKK